MLKFIWILFKCLCSSFLFPFFFSFFETWVNKTSYNWCEWGMSFIDFYLVFPANFRIVFLPPDKQCNYTETALWFYPRAWLIIEGPGCSNVGQRYLLNKSLSSGLVLIGKPVVLSTPTGQRFILQLTNTAVSPCSSPLRTFHPGETSLAARSEEKRLYSQAIYPWSSAIHISNNYNSRHVELGHSLQQPYVNKKLCSFPPNVEFQASVMPTRKNQHWEGRKHHHRPN